MKRQIFYLLLILYIFIPHPSYAQDTVFLGSIPADKGIDSIALSPNTGVAYGISKEEKSVYIFDLESYLVKNRVKLNKKPRAIAVNPLNNRAYVTSDSGEGFLYVIDSDGNILNTIEILKDPRGIAINSDNNTAVIAIEKDKKLLILSVAPDTVTVTNEIPLPHRPRLISLDTDSNRAVVVAAKAEGEGEEMQNVILIVGLNAGNVIYNIELERKIKGIAVDIEKDIAVATTKENINLIDINTMDVLKTIDAKDAYGVDINQSTHKAVIGYKKGFLLIDLNTFSVTEYYLDKCEDLRAVAADRYRNTALISSMKSIIEIQLPNPVPEITNLIPESARVGDSDFALTLEGERFLTTSSVQFGQNNPSTDFIDNNTLEATVPSSLITTPGTVPVTVTNPPPDGGISVPYSFKIKYPLPILTSISPDTVPAGSPDFTLKVFGSNFRPGYSVNFNGENLVTTYINPNEFNAIVPSSLITTKGTYPVIVINPDRYNSNLLYFTVIAAPPRINDFTPRQGTVGTIVKITGENFQYTPTKVYFNETQATIQSLSATEIKTAVPLGATTGLITITTGTGTATTTEPFEVILRQDFTLNVNPKSVSIPTGGTVSFTVNITGTGVEPFTGIVELSTDNIPDITATFAPEYISSNQTSILNITASLSQQTSLNIHGTANIDGADVTRTATVTLHPIAPGTTTLSGQILATKDANPIKGVTLRLGEMTAPTDDAGNFIFIDPPTGQQVLLIDGDTANTETASYPSKIPVPVTITGGVDNKLPYPVYLHEVNTKNFAIIDSSKDTVLTDPEIPDYQLLIPAGTIIMGYDGEPNTRISVDPVLVDRLPIKPPPEGVYARTIFMYYFFKPGGGIPNRPVPVIMPNEAGALPGERVTLWYYDESFEPDPDSNQWKVFGMGTVSPDGKNIIPDPGVGIPKFCCGASFPAPPPLPPPPPPDDDCPKGVADPVDPRTGVYFSEETDLAVHGGGIPVPLKIKRIYRTRDDTIGPFGRGTSFNWGDTIYVIPGNNQSLTMVTQGNAQYIFSLGPDGYYTNTRWPFLRGTRIRRSDDGTLTEYRRDGTIRKYRLYDTTMGRLYEVTDRNGNTITLDLDIAVNPVKITDSNGRGFTITWSENVITSIRDHAGRQVTYTYSDNSNLVSVTKPDGSVTAYTYDDENRRVSVTNSRGVTVLTNEYDADGRVIRQTHANGGVFNLDYYVVGGAVAQAKVTDPNGNTTTYRFNGSYYTVSRTDSYGQTTYYDRNYATNFLMSVTDHLGRVTKFTYDQNGNTTSIVDPAWNTTIIENNQVFNKLARLTDALGNVWVLNYDSKGNLISIAYPSGNTMSISYNKYGEPVSVTDALGNIYTFEYDEYGNVVKATDPLGNTAIMQYNALSKLIEVTDPRGRTTSYSYDLMGRITEVVDAIKGSMAFTYDENGNLLTVTDAKNQTITHTYNERDKVSSMTDQLGRVETYGYDLYGNLAQITDRKGQTTTFSYDKRNRIIKADYADGNSTSYFYDAVGKLTTVTDTESGAIQYVYSNAGCAACGGGVVDKVIQAITPLGTIDYTYDAIGRKTSMTVAGQEPVTYQYDANGSLTDISTWNLLHGALNFNIGYDELGRRTSLTLPNGITTNYTYDNASRLLNLEHLDPLNAALESLSYTYDANGNRISMDRLNIIPELPVPVSDINYDQANQMLTFKPESEPVKDITYDENGNMTSATNSCGTTTYTWDARNRLVSIDGFDDECILLTASFKYDARGRRIEKMVNSRTIQYLYDGLDIVQEIEDGVVTVNYIGTLNIDEPLARIEADTGTIRYYQSDALGSIVALTDDNGNVVTQYSYSPFGEVTISGELSDNPFQYTGRENDETGLYYYRARYYNPAIKRFISEDPIGLGGGINFYAYVGNNPVTFLDPWGLQSDQDLFIFWFGISFGEYTAEQAWESGRTPNFFETSSYALIEALKQKYNLHGYSDPMPTSLDEFEPWRPWPIENLLDPYRDSHDDQTCPK